MNVPYYRFGSEPNSGRPTKRFVKERLLQYLCCPLCAGAVKLAEVGRRDGGEIIEAGLLCASCKTRWPVTRGVPRFASIEGVAGDKAATAESFGWQWQHFTQTDEKYEQQFLGWLAPVTPELFKDKVVLEGGCGKGRHTQLAAQWGARDVIGVDLSAAVETAYAATRELGNAHVVQADILNLPFARVFDYAFSVGVLHHLPDPRAGFKSLASKVKRGGHISAWVYGAENNEWITRWVNPLRARTSRMNPHALLQLSKLPAAIVFAAMLVAMKPTAMKFQTQDLIVSGDYAIETGSYEVTSKPPQAAKPAHDVGKYLVVWKKQSDGSYKLFRDIGNSDLPPMK